MIYIKGIFKIIDTHGYPLDMALQRIDAEGMAIDWEDFLNDAHDAEWSSDKASKCVLYAMGDIYHSGMPVIVPKLTRLINKIWSSRNSP